MKNKEDLSEGNILKGPYWDEPVEVISVKETGEGRRIFWRGTNSGESDSSIFYPDDLDDLEILKKEEPLHFSSNPKKFRQAVEANRIKVGADRDLHFALNSSKIDPVPHQLEAVYKYMLNLNPVRFFLADDAGAGKTIMSGLLLKELKQRGIIRNCLVMAPAKLMANWQSELEHLFDEKFTIIRKDHIKNSVGNPWKKHKFCIISMAFAIQDYVRDSLKDMQWDLFIADEAHHLSAYRYGSESSPDKTERYKVAEIIRDRSVNTLFLSATPHKGDRDHFQLLLKLMDRNLFAGDQLPRDVIHSDEPGTVFLRRMKEDMVDIRGEDLFKDRIVHTVSYEIEGEELDFYQDVTDYVQEQFQNAWKKNNRNVQFALMILQRRVASSIAAAKKSFERRKEGLEELLEDIEKLKEIQEDQLSPGQQTLEEIAEKQRWDMEERAIKRLTMSKGKADLKKEINTLEKLVRKAEHIMKTREEKKLKELRTLLRGEKEDTPFFKDEKLLIFTEAKDTLDFLVEKLGSWGYDTITIHGGMNMGGSKNPSPGTRLWAQQQFNNADGPQILVATEAAGEGINLHRQCRLMVNYDLPWNPTLLEQRMGRIHRYGQDDPVHIYNLVASNTREGYVLEKLSLKLEKMKNDIGSDRVFDVINEITEGVKLRELMQNTISGVKDEEAIDMEFDEIDQETKEIVQRAKDKGMVTEHIDLSQVKEDLRENKEKRLSPEYIEKFFINSYRLLGGDVEKRTDGLWRISWVPADIRRICKKDEIDIREPEKKYTKFTFYKDESEEYSNAEFIAPGHPLFETVLKNVEKKFGNSLNDGGLFIDPDTDEPYFLWFIKQEIQNSNQETVSEKIFCIRYDKKHGTRQVSDGVLHDLKPADRSNLELGSEKDIEKVEKEVKNWFFGNIVTEYRDEIKKQEKEKVETMLPSMKQSLNGAISRLSEEIQDFKDRATEKGEDMDVAISQKEEKRKDLIDRRDEQIKKLEKSKRILPGDTEFIGTALVIPASEKEKKELGGMARDEEVEKIAIEMTKEYEKRQGREPESVEKENLGFDLRSLGEEETRYIEVKGRAGEGKVSLTENEWTKANRLEDEYWLYVVTNTKSDPQLHIVQDPASNLEPDAKKIVRYLVGSDKWKKVAKEV